MKSLISLFVLLPFFISFSNAQTIVNSRTSVLQRGDYSISGNAILEELSDGKVQLRLDDDFATPAGPDVRVFLSDNPNSTNNGVEVADIGTGGGGINHFSGAITFNVPAGTGIDDFDFIVFYCVAFRQHWASGNFGATEGSGGGNGDEMPPAFECQETIAATTNWATEVTICENDGEADVIPLLNTLMIPAGDNYAYIITDGNNRIEKVILEAAYDFEGSGLGINRVYGVSYDGTLNYTIGSPFTSITADGCAILSDNALFLTVTKEDCTPAFECQETVAATTNWATEVTICENDGEADVIPLLNTLMIPAGDNYAYIITDGNNRIEKVILEAAYDFEGSGLGINRVYGISYDGTLNYTIGSPFTSITADGCAILSDNALFLTVTKEDCTPAFECQETVAATTNWATEVTICENDGEADVIPLLNTLMIPAGDNYAYIITDGNNRIEKVILEAAYDFEGSGLGINRVYGISYDGTLNYTIGSPFTSITADGCAILSDNALFLTVTKEDCTPAFECQETVTATTNWVSEITICPNDGEADVIPLLNTLMIPAGDNYAYIITGENNLIEKVLLEAAYDFEGSGLGINRIYGVSYDGTLNYTVGNPLSSITADGCAILSASDAFLTVTKEICKANITGNITTQAGVGLEGFEIMLNNGATTQTAADGSYAFTDVPTNVTYEITPQENSGLLNGVTAFDLVLVRKHILGSAFFENVYQIIAADANNDGKVSTLDLLELRKLILGISQELPNNQSWRFVNLEETTNNDLDPFAFTESIIIENLTSNTTNINFLGVKIGDVSSAANNGLLLADSRSSKTLQFNTTDILLKAGQAVEIPVTAENFDQIIGYQFTMHLDGLAFVGAKAGVLTVNKNNFMQLNDQTVTTVWSNENAITTTETLFTLVFKATQSIQLSEALSFNSKVTPALAYEASAKRMDIDLSFQPITATTAFTATQLLQNEPNPFFNETTIGFQLANTGAVVLQVFDATGRNIITKRGEYAKGTHHIRLTDADNLPAGLLYYQLSAADFQATKRMVRGRK